MVMNRYFGVKKGRSSKGRQVAYQTKAPRGAERWKFEKPLKFPVVTIATAPIDPVTLEESVELPAFVHTAPIALPVDTHAAIGQSRDTKELTFCRQYAKVIGGECEFPCPAGRIDILTEVEVIEVKIALNWKHGIGQALVYSSYFPARQAVLLLLDDADGVYQELAQHHCDRLGIVLRCESSDRGRRNGKS